MGANAQTSVPLFSSGEVLTAANQNLSAGTGVPVFATTTTRDAAFGGTGEKVLAEGQLCYIEASDVVQYYNGTAWATVGPASSAALTLISSTTIGSAVASVTVSSAFSSTYDNYLVIVGGGAASTTAQLNLTFGSTATGYYRAGLSVAYGGSTVTAYSNSNDTSIQGVVQTTTNQLTGVMTILSPNLAERTFVVCNASQIATTGGNLWQHGFENSDTQHTAFTLTTSGGTMTGGTVRVYGYANS